MARTLTSFGSDTPPADGFLRYDSSNAIQAQSFKLSDLISPYVTSIKVYMKKVGSPATSNMYAEIHSSKTGISQTVGSSTNIVGGSSDAVSTSTLTTSYAAVTFSWSSDYPELDPDTTYYLVLYATGVTISSSNYIKVGNNSNVTSDGVAHKISTGNVWVDANAYDYTIYVYGQESISISDSETILVADEVSATMPAATDYRYYLCSSDGKIYVEHPDYKHDNNETITVQFLTKTTDYVDQDPEALGKNKAAAIVRLWYVDLTADVTVTVSVSTDEGTTWTTNTKIIGTGSEITKTKDFFFTVAGDIHQFKVSNTSGSDDVKLTAMAVFYQILGDYFEV